MKSFYTTLLVLLATINLGCSKGDESKASPPPSYNGDIQVDANGIPLLECTKFISKMGSISGYVKVLKHNNIFYSDKVDVKLTSSMDLHNKILSFYRWKQESNGQYVPDQNELDFDVNINGQIYTGFSQLTATSAGQLNTNQVSFTVHGTDIGYHAVQVVIYDSVTLDAIAYSDALIPFVYAHPKKYKETHNGQNLLQALHPYISQVNATDSAESFARKSYSDFCF